MALAAVLADGKSSLTNHISVDANGDVFQREASAISHKAGVIPIPNRGRVSNIEMLSYNFE